MEYRTLGGAGLKVSSLCFGLATFGGAGEFFKAWGSTGVKEARKLLGICLDAGINVFDTADIYSACRNKCSDRRFAESATIC